MTRAEIARRAVADLEYDEGQDRVVVVTVHGARTSAAVTARE